LLSFGAESLVFQFAIQQLEEQNVQNYNFAVVWYGCVIWSLKLREERRLRVFENRVLGRIFGPKRDEVTGELRKLHNEERNLFYSTPNVVRVINSRRMKWAGHVVILGEGVRKVLVGKPEGTIILGKPWSRWKDNIKMDLQDVGCGGMDWVDLAQDRDVGVPL
jgi:hypothetical protein